MHDPSIFFGLENTLVFVCELAIYASWASHCHTHTHTHTHSIGSWKILVRDRWMQKTLFTDASNSRKSICICERVSELLRWSLF